jgi:hypothetical protein
MTDTAFGREIQCTYYVSTLDFFWPAHRFCFTFSVDYSAKFEAEKHSFSGSPSQKSEAKTFYIRESPQVDFIPSDILSEFPNLNGIPN